MSFPAKSEPACRSSFSGVPTQVDHGSTGKMCRDLDLNGIPCDVRREDPEAPLPLFYPYLWLDPWMPRGRKITTGV